MDGSVTERPRRKAARLVRALKRNFLCNSCSNLIQFALTLASLFLKTRYNNHGNSDSFRCMQMSNVNRQQVVAKKLVGVVRFSYGKTKEF